MALQKRQRILKRDKKCLDDRIVFIARWQTKRKQEMIVDIITKDGAR